MTRCRSCEAPIVWALTPGGKRIPLDADPVPDGNAVIIERRAGVPVIELIDLADVDAGAVRYRSHFATCPQANEWRKTR